MGNAAFNEKTCLLNLKSGSQAAFAQIYRLHSPRIYRNTLKSVQYEDLAEDILQNTFLKIWENREKIDPDKPLIGYLIRIAQNLVSDYYRRAASDRALLARLAVAATEFYDHIEETFNFKESQEIFNTAIDQLPPQRKKVFTLFKVEGKSYEEISEILGISTRTVGDHMQKATKSVREHFFLTYKTVLLAMFISIFERH